MLYFKASMSWTTVNKVLTGQVSRGCSTSSGGELNRPEFDRERALSVGFR